MTNFVNLANGRRALTIPNTNTISGVVTNGGLIKDGVGKLILGGVNTYSGGTIVSNGILEGFAGSLQGNITNYASVIFIQTVNGTYSNVLSGSGSLTKMGDDYVLTMTNDNTYTGPTYISNGFLRITHANGLGTVAGATTVGASGGLQLDGGITTAAEPLTLAGAGYWGNALDNVSGDNTFAGPITLTAGAGIRSQANQLTLNSATDISGAGYSLEFRGGGTTLVTSVIGTGAGRVTKIDAGTLILRGANTYSGGTLVSGGILEGDTTGLQGIITNNATVRFRQSGNGTYAGVMEGTGAVGKYGSGNVTFTASSISSGNTTVYEGGLIQNGTNASSAVTVNSGAFFYGAGQVAALTISGQASAGSGSNTVGKLTTAAVNLQNDGKLQVNFSDMAGTAGTEWDLVDASGAITVNAADGNDFVIALKGSPAFTSSQGYTNTILTTSGSLSGFATNKFTISTAEFTPALAGGAFSINESGSSIRLIFTPAAVPLSDPIWDGEGSDGNWGTPENWGGDVVPDAGTNVIFYSGIGSGTNININVITNAMGLRFNDSADTGLVIWNNALTIDDGGIAVAAGAGALHIIASPLSLSAAQSWTNESTQDLRLTGVVSGSGDVTKRGDADGRILLEGDNTFSGTLTIQQGRILVTHSNSLGSVGAGTAVDSGSGIQIQGGIETASEPLTLTGNGYDGGGALDNVSGNNIFNGPVTLAGNARISSQSGVLRLRSSTAISGSDYNLEAAGGGIVQIDGVIGTGAGGIRKIDTGDLILANSNNTFTGSAAVSGGVLRIIWDGSLGAVPGSATPDSLRLDGGVLAPATNVSVSIILHANRGISLGHGGGSISNAGPMFQINGVIAGNGPLTKDGYGPLTLLGDNTYTGRTIILGGGYIAVTNDSGLGVPPSVPVTNQIELAYGVLNFSGNNTLNSNRGIFVHSVSYAGLGTASGMLTYNGVISGSGPLSSSGPGTLRLGGQNTFHGVFSITGNSLILNGTNDGVIAKICEGGSLMGVGQVGVINLSAVGGSINP
ncbi:MAG: autotransporter-associated beta strand repeat-containing protein, partial [Lentisphaerota bacterium]